MTMCDVIILGAGPYGLAAASHLRRIKDLDIRVFGQAMSFWENMPAGMLLRSNWTATHIADPDDLLGLESYQAECGASFATPVPVAQFIQYGKWYQRKAVPDLDRRKITLVEPHERGFRVTLEDGEHLVSRKVVVAAGIAAFAYRPPEFCNLPASAVSHTSAHCDLGTFAGKEVLVVGGGQSALESAALLRENGARSEVVTRAQQIHWLQGWVSRALHFGLGTLTNRLLYAPTDVGPAGISQLVARPDLLKRLPRRWQDALRQRSVRPAGARWLVDRLRDVPINLGCAVTSTSTDGERLRVRLDNGTERIVDHLLLGTGFRVDISRYPFLAPELVKSLRTFNGFPVLRDGQETSVAGLHIIGSPASWSFGPLLMFVSGTHYASRRLARRIAESFSRPLAEMDARASSIQISAGLRRRRASSRPTTTNHARRRSPYRL